ncbi:MAG: metalloregulator ArsR/SmtB family transcription factor [Candidatus Saccharimonadales bacterium]
MVERSLILDKTFMSLADPTRRDILRRIGATELSIGEIARNYQLTFGAISKHLKVLENADLIIKKKRGKEQIVSLTPRALIDAHEYIEWFEQFWTDKVNSLALYLKEEISDGK